MGKGGGKGGEGEGEGEGKHLTRKEREGRAEETLVVLGKRSRLGVEKVLELVIKIQVFVGVVFGGVIFVLF